jgi:leader peptidase (prepilin peptidase)/N-methyltransferase
MNELQLAYIPAVYLLLVGIPIVYIDLRENRIPNKLVLPATGALIITTLVLPFITGDWLKALLTILIAFAVFSLLTYFSFRGWIGMGDVKLVTTMGMALSPFSLANWAWLVGGVVLIVGMVVAYKMFISKRTKDNVPLAPTIYFAYTLLVGIIIYTN